LPAKEVEELVLYEDLQLYIIGGTIAAFDGSNGYRRARAAYGAGYPEQRFLRRWLALAEKQLERYGPPPGVPEAVGSARGRGRG
jgi:hypothetical protein